MDADRKMVTYKHLYKYIYTETRWVFWGLLDFDNVDDGKVGLKDSIEWNQETRRFKGFWEKYKSCFMLSGDADFGMNIRSNGESCEKYIKNSDKKLHMFPNFSLIPVPGGMNKRKNNWKDHFPRFSYNLARVCEGAEEAKSILAGQDYTDEKGEMIKDYFQLFDSVYDYFDKVYLVNDFEFINCLIGYGSVMQMRYNCGKQMESDDFRRYCALAIQYWEKRKQRMKDLIPRKEWCWLEQDIDALT